MKILNKFYKCGFDKKFFKFIIVGIINTLFGTVIMFTLYNFFHFDYYISSFSNYFFGSILSYFLNKYFTFNYNDKDISTIIKFIINISICYLLSYGVAKFLTRIILAGVNIRIIDNISMVLGMGLFTFCNYFGQRYFVFNKKNSGK